MIFLVLLSLLSCSESTKKDETVSARVSGMTVSRELSADYSDSYEILSNDNLLWYYTAVKKDKYFTTGQVTELTALNGGALGLPDSSFGTFSVGTWLFQFYAYEADDCTSTTDDDGNTTYTPAEDAGYYYSAADLTGSSYYTSLSSSNSSVKVSVQLMEAVGDTGTLVIGDSITFPKSAADESSIEGDVDLYLEILSGDETVMESTLISTYTASETDGAYTLTANDIYEKELSTGYYTLILTVTASGDDEEISTATITNVLIRANLETEITGTVDGSTTDAYIEVITVLQDTIPVTSAEELLLALEVEGATVQLASDISITSALSVSGDSTIDLGGYTLSSSSSGITVSAGASLTITGSGTVSSTYQTFTLREGSSLTLEGGTYSTTNSYGIYVADSDSSSDGGETSIEITGADISGLYGIVSLSADGVSVSVTDGSITATSGYGVYSSDGDLVVDISGGEITSYYDSIVSYTDDDISISISGGSVTSTNSDAIWVTSGSVSVEISGGTVTSSSGTALWIDGGDSEVTISGGTLSGGSNGLVVMNTVTDTDITITGGTITGSDFSLTVNGLVTADDGVTLDISGDAYFDGLMYLAGYVTTTISGGSFYNSDGQALHVRSGSITITGGTFTGTHPDEGYAYEYIYAGGGSANQYGDVVIEASSGYPLLSIVVAEDGGSLVLQDGDNYGIHYYLDPSYSDTTPSISIGDGVNYTAHNALTYRKAVTDKSNWYLYYSSADDASATSFDMVVDGTTVTYSLGDLYAYSTDGWTAYSE